MSRFRINGFSFSLGQFLFVLFVLLALFVRHLSRYGNTSQPTHHPPVTILVGGDHTVLPPNPPLPWSSLHATPSLSQSRFLMNVPWNSPWSPAPVAPQWLHDAVSTGRQPGNAAGDAIINFFCQNSYLEATFFHWGYRDIFLKVSLLHSTLNSFYPIIDKGMSPSRSGLLDMSWQIARRPLYSIMPRGSEYANAPPQSDNPIGAGENKAHGVSGVRSFPQYSEPFFLSMQITDNLFL